VTTPPPPPGPYGPPPGQYPGGLPPGPYGGPPPPPNLPVTKRIPEDQPFIVRASAGKRALQFGILLGVLVLLLACPLGLAAADSGELGAPLAIVGCLVVFLGALFGLQVYLLVSGGPVLAVGPQGLWIKTRPTRGQAIWLPWELVERVYRRRWAFDKMVCVKPRDPRVGGNLGAFTALDSSVQQLVFGSGFTATLNFADRKEEEIMGALHHFAAGRARVE
jgi:hypothetical protein